MQVTLLQNSLSKAVKTAGKTLQNKPQLPILSSILLTAKDDQLSLAATDLYMGIRITLPAQVKEEGVLAVQGRVLVEAISSLTGGKITLGVKGDQLEVSSDTGASFTISGQAGEEYPDFPEKEGEELVFSAEQFQTIEKSLTFATALDQARLTLTTLHLAKTDSNLEVAATDGFRLAVLNLESDFNLSSPLLIPAKAMSEVSRLLDLEGSEDSQVEIMVSDSLKQVFLTTGNTEVFIRLIEGEYPPYQKIIPAAFLTELNLDAAEFLQQLRQASVFARDVSNIVTLRVVGEGLEIKAQGPNGSYSSTLTAEIIRNDQDQAEISFNVRYLLEFLQAMKPEKIWLGVQESLKPAMFRIEGNKNFRYVVMPFRLNQA